jgi:uncharacterized membrane-anchored protein
MIALYLIGVYLVAGFVFAIVFLWRWIDRGDESVRGTPWTFKLTLLPGCIVFWPVLFKKYLTIINTSEND